jgi:hypothetical protein
MTDKSKKEDSNTEIHINRKYKFKFLNEVFESDDETNVYLG